MRRIEVEGRIGGDAKVELTKNGTQVLKFRIAGSEPGETEPLWFTVSTYDSFYINKLSQYLKKGTPVHVFGGYNDGIYTKQDGTVAIARNISAKDISFIDCVKKDGEGNAVNEGRQQTNQTQPVQVQQVQAIPVQSQPINVQPIQAKPIQAQPIHVQPIQGEPIQAQMIQVQQPIVTQVQQQTSVSGNGYYQPVNDDMDLPF